MRSDIYEKLIAYILANQNSFYRFAFSYVKNQDDALDAVQNAVCKSLEKYTSIKYEDAMKTWFYKILVNECLSLLRNRTKTVPVEDNPILEQPYEEKAYETDTYLSSKLNILEDDTAAIIRLRFFEELSLNEIAGIMKMNLSTVKSKLYRGLKSLKITLEEEAL